MSSALVAAQDADSIQRKRRGWRLLWCLLGGLGLVLLMTPVIAYLIWQSRGRSLLKEQIDRVQASGEPLTTAEMHAWYALPEGARDITGIWHAALIPFGEPAYATSTAGVPLVGTGPELPPLTQPLLDEKSIRDFLALHHDKLAALHAAAKEEGEVRFPRRFEKGIVMVLTDVQLARDATRLLALEFQLLVREKQYDRAIENLQARSRIAEIFHADPTMITVLVRIAIYGTVWADVRQFCATQPLTDAQLQSLQEMVRRVKLRQHVQDAMLGERAFMYHSFHLPLSSLTGSTVDGNIDLKTTDDVNRVRRPEDAAFAMAWLTAAKEAFGEAPAVTLEKLRRMDNELKLNVSGGWINRWRYMQTATMLPAFEAFARGWARGEALRDITDAQLAIRRYELKHGAPPEQLTELVPDFLPAVPSDPFSGQPLSYVKIDGRRLLYSVGEDGVDHRGQTDAAGITPDIAMEVLPAASLAK